MKVVTLLDYAQVRLWLLDPSFFFSPESDY